MAVVSTIRLAAGAAVYTTGPCGHDFGIPLVGPKRSVRGREVRTVRNAVRCRGGFVVWFTDGTKTSPLHGRTAWVTADLNIS